MKVENPNYWQQIAYKACRATLGAKALYESVRLKSKVTSTIENDFWINGVIGLYKCMKPSMEEVQDMQFKDIIKDFEILTYQRS